MEMYYITIIPASVFSLYMIFYLRSLAKHDKVLYDICQVRRDTMLFLYNDVSSISKKDYIAARNLVLTLNVTIKNYNTHKTALFNLRKFLLHVQEYESFSKNIHKAKLPDNEKIRGLYDSAYISFLNGFFSYTPLIKSEFTVRGLMFLLYLLTKLGIKRIKDSAKQMQATIISARETGTKLGVC